MSTDYYHQSVLAKEVLQYLQPQKNQDFIDCTLGGGGHTSLILEQTKPNGKVLAFERDQTAIQAAKKKLNKDLNRLFIVNSSYTDLNTVWPKYQKKMPNLQGILLDLGLSSDQLDKANRGFSFKDQGPLDMRFDDKQQTLTASDIILEWPEDKLNKIFWEYGEEKKARALTKGIIKNRSSWMKQKQKFITTAMFVSAILQILKIKESSLARFRVHPATKVFQALRIAVNDELNNVASILPQALDILPVGGRLAVISFHSLEDRIVKNYFKSLLKTCVCPKSAPICTCKSIARAKILTTKGIRPSAEEVKNNYRSRSATLRVISKL